MLFVPIKCQNLVMFRLKEILQCFVKRVNKHVPSLLKLSHHLATYKHRLNQHSKSNINNSLNKEYIDKALSLLLLIILSLYHSWSPLTSLARFLIISLSLFKYICAKINAICTNKAPKFGNLQTERNTPVFR